LKIILNAGCCASWVELMKIFLNKNQKPSKVLIINLDLFSSYYESSLIGNPLLKVFNDCISAKVLTDTKPNQYFFKIDSYEKFIFPHYSKKLLLSSDGSYHVDNSLPEIVAKCVDNLWGKYISDFEDSKHDLFIHPGGSAIFHAINRHIPSAKKKMNRMKKHFLKYGNMGASSLDVMIKNAINQLNSPSLRGNLLSFGPGITCVKMFITINEL
jgi:predicted naringenin-chalcone synthase